MALRNILEQYPSHQLCRSKIAELDGRITTFQMEKTKLQAEAANPMRIEGLNREISALAELRGCMHALLDYMCGAKANLSGAENEYGQILRELMVLKPETAETEADRKGLIERAKSLTERLQKTLETLKDFDSPEGPADELQDLRRDTKTNVRVLLKGFFGENESAAAEIEKQLELRPSENERRLAAFFYTQANPRAKKVGEALDKFFASKEYKTLKAKFVAALKKRGDMGAVAKIFAETEFAKLAAIKTPEERRKHEDVTIQVMDYGLDSLAESGNSVAAPYCIDSGKAEFLKAESGNERENMNTREFLLQIKFMLLRFDENDLSYALPSYALLSLFKKGKLAELGIQDEEFAKMIHYNAQGGYLNFARWTASGNLCINGDGAQSEVLKAAVLQGMQEIARELVPAFNASSGYKKGLGESGMKSPGLTEYRKCGLRVNTHTGAAESELPASEPVNQVGHVVYQFNKQEGEEAAEKHLANQKMVFGKEEAKPLDLASISEFKDVPEGYPLQQLLKQIEDRLNELLHEIYFLKNHKRNVTAEEKQEIENKLNELSALYSQIQDIASQRDDVYASYRKARQSRWPFGREKRTDALASEIKALDDSKSKYIGVSNERGQWFRDNYRNGCNGVDWSHSQEGVEGLRKSLEEYCVVGLDEKLQPLIDEFARLQKTYKDIYEQYSKLFDKELADYKNRQGQGFRFGGQSEKMKSSDRLGYTSLECLLRQ
ncbi:MAG: hypothetical protein AAB739_01230 [Patescibacteria group bacterium]